MYFDSSEIPKINTMRYLLSILFTIFSISALAGYSDVRNQVAPRRQPKTNSCWLTVGAMLYGYRNAPIAESTLAKRLGHPWKEMYELDTGLSDGDVPKFAKALGFPYEGPLNPSIEGWRHWLERGPVWVGVNIGKYAHVILLTGLTVSNEPDRSTIYYNDPSDGGSHSALFRDFLAAFENHEKITSKENPVYQIIHR